MKKYIGVDIGGTNIRVALVDENNNILYFNKEKTLENVNNANDLYNKILSMLKKVENIEECSAIGIGVPGAVKELKEIMTCRNIELLKNFPLKERIEKDLNIKVVIENDAKVAALAEAVCGAGAGSDIVTYVTISTGLGGATIINCNIYNGANGVGSYLSRMILDGSNMSEHLISGTALIDTVNERCKIECKSAQEVFKLADNNDTIKEIISNYKKYVLALLLNISITINPNAIVLGGGVMKAKEYFLEEVKKEFIEKAHSFARNTKILEAKLEEPGVIGAAILAKQNIVTR